jgi:eukaryotic-like serine/threonine-protein kinase
MPVPTSTEDYLEVVRKSQVVPAPRLDAFLSETPSTASTPAEMSDLLLAHGLITRFQSEQLLQGKWLGFFIGKYKVLERLGSGGMGTVYLCEHVAVSRRVALKVLPRSHASDPSALARFYREARAAGGLDHPNLVKAHDVDQDGHQHFMVMDYVHGTSLQDLVTRHGPLPVARACAYVCQAAAGLAAAHEAGLIHRDVKPANIMLERNGNIRVLDLGLARFYNDDLDQLTLQYDQDNVLGTPDYVAPEQALDSHGADIRCDIYSLGATFYFLLTGQPPFAGGKVATKLIRHQVAQPTAVRELRAEVPREVQAVVERMMAKNPAARYQTLPEAIADLSPMIVETVAPPTEDEMPTLSRAAAAPPSMAFLAEPSSKVGQLPRRSSQSVPRPLIAPDPSGRVSTMNLASSASGLATPKQLPTAQAPRHPGKPVPAPPVAPSRALEHAKAPKPSTAPRRTDLSIALVAVLCCLIGLALSVWLMLP